jgi:hypothetical protein
MVLPGHLGMESLDRAGRCRAPRAWKGEDHGAAMGRRVVDQPAGHRVPRPGGLGGLEGLPARSRLGPRDGECAQRAAAVRPVLHHCGDRLRDREQLRPGLVQSNGRPPHIGEPDRHGRVRLGGDGRRAHAPRDLHAALLRGIGSGPGPDLGVAGQAELAVGNSATWYDSPHFSRTAPRSWSIESSRLSATRSPRRASGAKCSSPTTRPATIAGASMR